MARLLVVDDNDNNRFTLTTLLEVEGFTDVSVAENGELALRALSAETFDLVLLDVMMPKLNGYQVLDTLRAQGRLGDPPIIMITALEDIDSAARCIELGAVDYLPKPFNPTLLKARIRATLEKKWLRDEIRTGHDRMEAELHQARDLQLGLCPRSYSMAIGDGPVEVFATMEPAREVGGDLYDVFERPDGSLCFVVGDVSDKGAAAALYMARTRDMIRLTSEMSRDGTVLPLPGEVLRRVNGMLSEANPSCMFVTLFLGVVRPSSGELLFANAGHVDPYVVPRNGVVEPLQGAKGWPLGIRRNADFVTESMSLGAGDALFLFSDGITEAFDGGGTSFSERRLQDCLRQRCDCSAAALVEAAVESVKTFVGETPQSDDITAMAVRLPHVQDLQPTET